MLYLIKRLHELVCEHIDPVIKIFLNVNQCAPNLGFPNLYEGHVRRVFDDSLSGHLLDAFEFLLVKFVLLVEVDKSLVVKHTQVALPLLLCLGVENSWPAVLLAI